MKCKDECSHLPIALVKEIEVVCLHRVEKHTDKVAVLNKGEQEHCCLPKMTLAYRYGCVHCPWLTEHG